MIPLFDRARGRLMAALLLVAILQLAATIFVARSLHLTRADVGIALLSAGALVAFACDVVQRRLSEALGLSYISAVREELFRHLMAVQITAIQERRHGAMLQSFVGDLTALRQWISEGILRMIVAVLALAGLLGWIALAQPRTALLLGAVVLAAVVAGAILLVPLAHIVRRVRRERGRVAAFASERLAASATVQICGRSSSETNRLQRRVERLNSVSLRRAWVTGALRALPHLATTAMLVIAFSAGAQTLSRMAGTFVIVGILGLALRDLARAGELMIPGRISRQRVDRLLALPANLPAAEGVLVRGETGELVFDQLRLDGMSRSFNAVARTGELIVLEGDPMMRRSLFRSIAGLEQPPGGSLRWNGKPLEVLTPSRRRRIVGLASADLPLVAGSTTLNLRYRVPKISTPELMALADRWQVPVTGPRRHPARIALLRAIAGKPPILLLELDDATMGETELMLLRDEVRAWSGVVLLATNHAVLRDSATRRWRIDHGGFEELGAPAKGALRLVAASPQGDVA